jgi:hypothetical protein
MGCIVNEGSGILERRCREDIDQGHRLAPLSGNDWRTHVTGMLPASALRAANRRNR